VQAVLTADPGDYACRNGYQSNFYATTHGPVAQLQLRAVPSGDC
jgi:hypothetical protein